MDLVKGLLYRTTCLHQIPVLERSKVRVRLNSPSVDVKITQKNKSCLVSNSKNNLHLGIKPH